MSQKIIEIIAVAYNRLGELKVFVQSVINQTHENWRLTVIHDGESQEFIDIMSDFARYAPERIGYHCTKTRFNDYGHSLRDEGIKQAIGDYVLLTNADNYIIPKFIEYVNMVLEERAGDDVDVIMYDMIHSHNRPGGRHLPSYSFFETFYKRGSIDMGAAVVKVELAKKAGFGDKSHDGDATYFEKIVEVSAPKDLGIFKIPRVLFVHN